MLRPQKSAAGRDKINVTHIAAHDGRRPCILTLIACGTPLPCGRQDCAAFTAVRKEVKKQGVIQNSYQNQKPHGGSHWFDMDAGHA